VDHKLGLDPQTLAAAVRDEIGDTPIRYAFDAVGGTSTERLAACLVEGGTIINYGALAGRPCQIWPTFLIFKDIKVQGFWVPRLFDQFPIERMMSMYGEILDHIAHHKMPLDPAARFSFDQLDEALSMAMRQQGGSKVILSP
jgi:NADPH:quinone reductase-like Zn-dependent oxidoreductase